METLWDGLSRPEVELESPAWHGSVLAETEKRLAEGREETVDWSVAKEELRKRTV